MLPSRRQRHREFVDRPDRAAIGCAEGSHSLDYRPNNPVVRDCSNGMKRTASRLPELLAGLQIQTDPAGSESRGVTKTRLSTMRGNESTQRVHVDARGIDGIAASEQDEIVTAQFLSPDISSITKPGAEIDLRLIPPQSADHRLGRPRVPEQTTAQVRHVYEPDVSAVCVPEQSKSEIAQCWDLAKWRPPDRRWTL